MLWGKIELAWISFKKNVWNTEEWKEAQIHNLFILLPALPVVYQYLVYTKFFSYAQTQPNREKFISRVKKTYVRPNVVFLNWHFLNAI